MRSVVWTSTATEPPASDVASYSIPLEPRPSLEIGFIKWGRYPKKSKQRSKASQRLSKRIARSSWDGKL